MKLIGESSVNFVSGNGETIKGKNLYVLYQDENVNGLKADKLWVKDGISIPADAKLNDMIDVTFNMKGRVESIKKA